MKQGARLQKNKQDGYLSTFRDPKLPSLSTAFQQHLITLHGHKKACARNLMP